MMIKAARKGFTLVELIIVIVILGILGTIAIPQFINSTKDAEDVTVAADLAVLRNALNLYYHQHNSTYPGIKDPADGSTLATPTAAAAMTQLTQYSDKDGQCSTDLDRTNFPYGPYVTSGIPASPVNGDATFKLVDTASPLAAGDVGGTQGWLFNPNTGEVRVNNTAYLNF